MSTRLTQHVPAAIHDEASQRIANELSHDINEAIRVFNRPVLNILRRRHFTYVIMARGSEPQGREHRHLRISHLMIAPDETLARQLQRLLPIISTQLFVLSNVQLIDGAEMCAYELTIVSVGPVH